MKTTMSIKNLVTLNELIKYINNTYGMKLTKNDFKPSIKNMEMKK